MGDRAAGRTVRLNDDLALPRAAAARLADVSLRQLDYLTGTGLVSSVFTGHVGRGASRVGLYDMGGLMELAGHRRAPPPRRVPAISVWPEAVSARRPAGHICIPVGSVVRHLAAGYDDARIRRAYPALTPDGSGSDSRTAGRLAKDRPSTCYNWPRLTRGHDVQELWRRHAGQSGEWRTLDGTVVRCAQEVGP